ncbi:DMT family transporter [Rhodospirillaceae bacterium SYSU D60014]|uniref:DMT family transporter n=1 Tax=Virgifigura deserti TaxID=2268457 RepID=UPI000E66E696
MTQLDRIVPNLSTRTPSSMAALWMTGAALFFAGLSGVIRHLTHEMHPFEVAFFRNLFGLAFLLPWLWRAGLGALRTERLGLYVWRAVIGLTAMLTSFSALALLPFAQAVAISFAAPMFATIGAALILREVVRARRWTATVIGFAGVLIILRPGTEGLTVGAALALLSAAISAVSVLIIKHLSRTESSNAIATYMVLLMTPMSLLPALLVWTWPEPDLWWLLVGMGALGTLGHLCYIRAFALADASAVMPYDYTRLVFASIIGYFAFAELPNLWTWSGAAVIVGAAIYIARREARLSQSAATQAAASAGAVVIATPAPSPHREDHRG